VTRVGQLEDPIANSVGFQRWGFEEGKRRTIGWYQPNTGWLDPARSGEYLNYYEWHDIRRSETFSKENLACAYYGGHEVVECVNELPRIMYDSWYCSLEIAL
jgi:hypothetical protein